MRGASIKVLAPAGTTVLLYVMVICPRASSISMLATYLVGAGLVHPELNAEPYAEFSSTFILAEAASITPSLTLAFVR